MIPRILLTLLLAAGFLAGRVHAQMYYAELSGASEVPPVVSSGTGWTLVTYNPIAHTLLLQVEFSGLTGNTTAAHIHAPVNLATGTAGVATQLPSFVGFPLGVTSGSYTQSFDLTDTSSFNPAFITASGGTVAGAEQRLANALADGRAYLNIHTTFVGSGEIRGDLVAVPDDGFALWLLVPALGALAGWARCRQARRLR